MNKCDKALGFWDIGIQYLHLVQAVSSETLLQENAHIVISDKTINENQYMEKTKWSDHNLVIPLLFNFYHGLETILKGYLCVQGKAETTHKLSQLLNNFKAEFKQSNLIPYFEKYIVKEQLPDILYEFCTISNTNIDDYYQSLKYSEGKNGNQFQHFPLKYQDSKGTEFFTQLQNDIKKIRKETVAFGRKICPKA